MIRRDLHTLEELDLAEENERLEKEKAEKEKLEKEKAGVPAPSDSSSFDFFDPSWNACNFSGQLRSFLCSHVFSELLFRHHIWRWG
ncbi:hypothetical protein DID88_002296 [Monilinia fructigena]|uniref:Uncharacterized protein n=1 Tax=Monilinia fructigena TaxID=38457 RepID=A0A395ICZ5_9HELO|nr:hypothetical protein DID88_002296 [Monilinia fructigena]